MTLISKADFARHVKRTAGRVSQWIGEGKLHGPALERTASGEKINLEIALEQLRGTLDPTQQLGLAEPILPTAGEADEDEPSLPIGSARAQVDDTDQRRLVKAKADAAETKAEQDRIALMAESRQWVRAAEVEASMQRVAAGLLDLVEAELPAMAEDLAAQLGGDTKAATIALRKGFRLLRQRIADEAMRRAESAPAPTRELVAA